MNPHPYYKWLMLLAAFFAPHILMSQTLIGKVTDTQGEALPYASVYVKGTSIGTTTNNQGQYSLSLKAGTYIIICQYVGFEKIETEIQLKEGNLTKNFVLTNTYKEIREVKISASAEDPAYEIIRQAIKKRPYYDRQIDAFKANCYIKGNMKLVETPETQGIYNVISASGGGESAKDMKNEIDSMKGIIYLSESYTEMGYRKKPEKFKINILSTKVSGNQNAYGFGSPMFINFYGNNISFGEQINARGYISPIANGALVNYKYKLLETYFEDGKWINKIEVIPRRKYEPTFSGIIHIIDGEWRLHSLDLKVTKENELNVIDTLRIKQIYVPVKDKYVVKDQTFGIDVKMFGFGVKGDFVNVFSNYSLQVEDGFFDKYIMEYDSLSLKRSDAHFDSIRTVPLLEEEIKDYHKKDSIASQEKSKADSLEAAPFSYKPLSIFQRGLGYKFNASTYVKTDPLLSVNSLFFNAVEGLNYTLPIRFYHKINDDKKLYMSATARYGFGNSQCTYKLFSKYSWGKTQKKSLNLSLGRYNFQFNNDNPISEYTNTIQALYYGRHRMILYQAKFLQANFRMQLINGISYKIGLDYQDRSPLVNTSEVVLFNRPNRFTPNYPTDLVSEPMQANARMQLKLYVQYEPGRKYIKYPDRIVSYSPGSKPIFFGNLNIAKPLLHTDADYTSWTLGVKGEQDIKLYGQFKYNLQAGGFLNAYRVFLPDYTHFNGNQVFFAAPYLNSFQLAPYYANSNTEPLYSQFHVEHHFNGFGTNKLPLFRNLKYYLVAASNGYYVNQHKNYLEYSLGLENLGFKAFRFFRLDGVLGYTNFNTRVFGFRFGFTSSFIRFGSRNDSDE